MLDLGFGKRSVRKQMYLIYSAALLVPILIIGFLLIFNANKILNSHYIELLETENTRVKTMLNEITTQIYNLSADICFNSTQKSILTGDYDSSVTFMNRVNEESALDEIVYSNKEVESVYIYTDNPSVYNYKQYHQVTEEVRETDWYQKAITSSGPFWTAMQRVGSEDIKDVRLCLVRPMTLPGGAYKAVVVIKVSDSYLRSKINSGIVDAISVDDSNIVYSSKKSWYGEEQFMEIDAADNYFSESGIIEIDEKRYFSVISTSHLYKTNSRLYICSLSDSGFDYIEKLIQNCVLILLLAIVVPGLILVIFTRYFTGRVELLRGEMHKASKQDYDIITDFSGRDELTEAFSDLKTMVQNIKEKDAQMYEAQLNEKELLNEQQRMEYKMLASQINPHFLYNTLETIRMKALTNEDREVADAIKILGKTLRYVLENTGTVSTTLENELLHIERYLTIQKLRFGDRINYTLSVAPKVNPKELTILPLLLQPVVENAVIHGLESLNGEGMISVEIAMGEKDCLLITVSDNGNGMTEEELADIRGRLNEPAAARTEHIGLSNINQRIRLCYGEEYGMEIEAEPENGTRIILRLPAKV